MLGPLVVARATFAIDNWQPGDPAPDLWKLLKDAVSTKPNDPRGRIAIADSKKLKRANDTPDPLRHLLHGVLTMLATTGQRPTTDAALFADVGATADPASQHACYAGEALPLPGINDSTAASIGIAANTLASVMADAGVRLLDLHAIVIPEPHFNALVKQHGTKAATTAHALATHLQATWSRFATGPDRALATGGPRVVCDRQGGRTDYGPSLYDWLPPVAAAARDNRGSVTMLEETPERCRYEAVVTTPTDQAGTLHASFQPEGETHHLPIALASMTAKLVRELSMHRFNTHWSARGLAQSIELKPTAGYVQDARRWLTDAKPLLTKSDRDTLIRIA